MSDHQPGESGHQHTGEEERRHREAGLDDSLEASFPASDPLSTDPNPDENDDESGEDDEPGAN